MFFHNLTRKTRRSLQRRNFHAVAPAIMVKKKHSGLGKSIIRSKFLQEQNQRKGNVPNFATLHSTSVATKDSVTEQSTLDDFLFTAELSGKDFAAEKLNQVIVGDTNTAVLSVEERQEIESVISANREKLRIPRRPSWNPSTSAEELDFLERTSFMEWRREMANLQENDIFSMTPFEKNIEMWRQLWRVVEKSDILVQIVDARNPLLFLCTDLTKYVTEVSSEKRNMLLINKSDFLTETQRNHWKEYFDTLNIDCCFYSAQTSLTGDHDFLIKSEGLIDIFKTQLKNISAQKKTIGLIGYPNVGKSSTINSLLEAKKVNVGSTPGKTKHYQTIWLDDDLCLCDCPGLVFPNFACTKSDLVVNGILPIDQIRECIGPTELVAQKIPSHVLERVYGITFDAPSMDIPETIRIGGRALLEKYATIRGFRTAVGGSPDVSRAARIILKDFVSGKLLFCNPPPGLDPVEFNKSNILGYENLLQFETNRIAPLPFDICPVDLASRSEKSNVGYVLKNPLDLLKSDVGKKHYKKKKKSAK